MAVCYERLWELLAKKNMKKLNYSIVRESAGIFSPSWEETNIFPCSLLKRYVEHLIVRLMK